MKSLMVSLQKGLIVVLIITQQGVTILIVPENQILINLSEQLDQFLEHLKNANSNDHFHFFYFDYTLYTTLIPNPNP